MCNHMQMSQTSTCLSPKCRQTVEGEVPRCPTCGTRMRTPTSVRRVGWLLLFLGVFLIVFMGWIALSTAPMMLRPGVEVADGSRFTGDADQGRMIMGLFGAVIAFGVATAIGGVVQIRTGKRNPKVTVAIVGMFAVLAVVALAVKDGLGG